MWLYHSLSIHLLMDMWAILSFEQLLTMLFIVIFAYVCVGIHFHFFWINTQENC